MSPTLQGILLRIAASACGAGLAAGVHAVADRVPTGQIVFWRSVTAFLPILIYIAWRHELRTTLRTSHPWLHVTRGVLGATAMVLFFVSVTYLPVTSASALGYLAPLMSLPIAALVLKERINLGIIGACLLGFAGVLLMLAPKLAGPSLDREGILGIAAGLAFAGCMAFVRVHVKTMSQTEPTGTISFYFTLICTLFGLCSLPFGWVPLGPTDLAILIGVGCLGGLAQITATEAVRRAPLSVLAPFDYTGIVFALSFDLVLFAQRPGWIPMIGVLAITLAGLWMVRMDRKPVRVVVRP